MGTIADRDPAYIWLRQTAEVMLGDQRRTLEIAVPVRPGATPEEIARLLDEAEAGMERLAERMDRRVTALHASAPQTQSAPASRPASPPARPATGIAERPVDQPRQTPNASPARSTTPTTTTPAASASVAPPATAPATPTSSPSASVPASGPLSRAEFLEQARGLGQSPRQVMERLGVRTLEGLNYAEALEQIKRQLLRESTQASQDATSSPFATPTPTAPSQPARASRAAPESATTRSPVAYFDEEDDYDVSFQLPDDGAASALDLDAEDAAMAPSARATAATVGEPVELDLEDVPDFAEPRPAARDEPTAKPRASAPSAATGSATDDDAARRPAPLTSHQALAQRARAHDLLARLREIHGGLPAGSDQSMPFANVVIQQLGEQTVSSLTDQVWGIAPAKLAAPQMRALIQWGKTDAFAAEVVAVLELLASEHDAETTAESKGPAHRPGRAAARTAGRGQAGSAR